MMCLKFSKYSILLMLVALCTIVYETECKSFYGRSYGYRTRPAVKLPRKGDLVLDGPVIDVTTQTKALLGDILCQVCQNTKNETCIARFCNTENGKNAGKSILEKGVDIERPSVALLGDALCQWCILTNNATCIARFCNALRVTEAVQDLRLPQIDRPISNRFTNMDRNGNMYKRSIADQEMEEVSSDMIEDIVNSYDLQ